MLDSQYDSVFMPVRQLTYRKVSASCIISVKHWRGERMGHHDRELEGEERNRRVGKGRETFSSSVKAFQLLMKEQHEQGLFGTIP